MQIKIISTHTKYKKNQIIDLAQKEAIHLLTTSKAMRVFQNPQNSKIKKDKKDNV